jgi:hypothetical protein
MKEAAIKIENDGRNIKDIASMNCMWWSEKRQI